MRNLSNINNVLIEKLYSNKIFCKKYLLKKYPHNLLTSISDVCNLRCDMCLGHGVSKDKCPDKSIKKGLMSLDNFSKIVNELSLNHANTNIVLQCRGEPFLNKDIFKMMDYCIDKNIFGKSIPTNGTLFTPDFQKEFIKRSSFFSDEKILGFSVDGMKESCEKIRKGVNYENLVNNINSFIELNNKNKKVKTAVFFTISNNDLLSEIDEYVDFWTAKGVDMIQITTQIVVDDEQVNRFDKDCIINNNLYKKSDLNKKIPCKALYRDLIISSDLKRFEHCEIDYFGKGKYDFTTGSISDLWNSEYYNTVRKNQCSNIKDKNINCLNCEVKYSYQYDLPTIDYVKEFNGYKYSVTEQFRSRILRKIS
ncbi:radical SAM protein [Methanoplanus sp. FWC-SCC4]|uniref:Radical SAM protein n=1 Tax=Methanochimaera problematica TaxID=2609417 RepID=A0AA97FAL6_9EURY|nr:radical SAM protein [Methanoplanus sp. FWC-SCC4]WOF15387.1 radical SAM protein [Methanoplanus sp. FWC-SCC4]